MRVPDEIRDCVAFVRAAWDTPEGPIAKTGSAFFVGMPLGVSSDPVTDRVAIYAVTAKHCVVHKDYGLAAITALQLNERAGGSDSVAIPSATWVLHPTADVAILPFTPDASVFEYKAYPVASAATDEFVKGPRQIGPGDDVFVVGQLVVHPGVTRIMPIVRIGNVAAFPSDLVSLETGPDVVALIEARSIGGLSGSPVFLHLPLWRDAPPGGRLLTTPESGMRAASGGEHRLLGVMHGFYPVGKNDPDGVSGGNEDLNTGIAVVVLVDRILELINGPEQVSLRDAFREGFVATSVPIPTSGEFERFEDLTDRLLRVPKAELDEKLKAS